MITMGCLMYEFKDQHRAYLIQKGEEEKMTTDRELKVLESRVKEVAGQGCVDTKNVLMALFPEAFPPPVLGHGWKVGDLFQYCTEGTIYVVEKLLGYDTVQVRCVVPSDGCRVVGTQYKWQTSNDALWTRLVPEGVK